MDKKFYLPILIAILTALIVFLPHYTYSFPLHIDEWHHITESIRLDNNEYSGGQIAYRLGFHVFLLGLSKVFDLVSIYQFLPAIWAALTSLVLFYVVSKKFNYSIAIFAMIFFASMKSNVNLLGPWFFVPLTFSFPFILLFIYFFDKGIQNQNKKSILISLAIMLFLIPIHSISVLFAVPIFLVYGYFNKEFILREKKFFSSFLIIPLAGILLFSFINDLSLIQSFSSILQQLQFEKGWGVLELNNSPLETYSLIGYILAITGFISLYKKDKKKYSLFLIWPIVLILSIAIFRIFEVSYLSPYQRNFYYLTLAMPFLSAVGLSSLISFCKAFTDKQKTKSLIAVLIITLTIFLAFQNYTDTPEQLELYYAIEQPDYETLLTLKTLNPSQSTIMTPPNIGVALYAITKHYPVATLSFYGNRDLLNQFYLTNSCEQKKHVLRKAKAQFIISKTPNLCNFELVRTKGTDYIYKFQ